MAHAYAAGARGAGAPGAPRGIGAWGGQGGSAAVLPPRLRTSRQRGLRRPRPRLVGADSKGSAASPDARRRPWGRRPARPRPEAPPAPAALYHGQRGEGAAATRAAGAGPTLQARPSTKGGTSSTTPAWSGARPCSCRGGPTSGTWSATSPRSGSPTSCCHSRRPAPPRPRGAPRGLGPGPAARHHPQPEWTNGQHPTRPGRPARPSPPRPVPCAPLRSGPGPGAPGARRPAKGRRERTAHSEGGATRHLAQPPPPQPGRRAGPPLMYYGSSRAAGPRGAGAARCHGSGPVVSGRPPRPLGRPEPRKSP